MRDAACERVHRLVPPHQEGRLEQRLFERAFIVEGRQGQGLERSVFGLKEKIAIAKAGRRIGLQRSLPAGQRARPQPRAGPQPENGVAIGGFGFKEEPRAAGSKPPLVSKGARIAIGPPG